MAKKKATGPKRRRKKSAAKKKADRILTEDQVRDLQGKIRLGMDQALASVATPDLSVDFPVRGEALSPPLSPKQLAKIFDLSWPTIKRWMEAGTVRAERKSFKAYLVAIADMPADWRDRMRLAEKKPE